MANKRIRNLVERSTLSSGDYFVTDNQDGTRKVNASLITTPLGNISNSSDIYSSSKSYKVGDVVTYSGVTYKCITACSAAAWNVNQNCFEVKSLAGALTDVNSALTDFNAHDGEKVRLYSYSGQSYLWFNKIVTRYENLQTTSAGLISFPDIPLSSMIAAFDAGNTKYSISISKSGTSGNDNAIGLVTDGMGNVIKNQTVNVRFLYFST